MTVPAVSPELPARSWRLLLAVLGRLPQGGLSRALGHIADLPIPEAARPAVLGAFARALKIDVAEAELPLASYRTLNEFFVRRLRPGARTWPASDDVIASPVDGILGQIGELAEGRVVQAKGRWYDAGALIGDGDEARRYRGGTFVTIYLSPRHYHRIHTPGPGVIRGARHIPGALLPVNAPAVAHVQDLFVRNERLVCFVDGRAGRMAVVAVGAYNVGRISAAFDPAWHADARRGGWVTNRPGARPEFRRYDPGVPVSTGQEIMAFHLGSTVVLLFEPGRVRLRDGLAPGTEVRVGEEIARVAQPRLTPG